MLIPQAIPGEVLTISPAGGALAESRSDTLVRSDDLEIGRSLLREGDEEGPFECCGEVVAVCIDGRVAVVAVNGTRELDAGQLLYLRAGETHSIRGLDDLSLVLTIRRHAKAQSPALLDPVEEASKDSFPASDAPAWTPTTSIGAPSH